MNIFRKIMSISNKILFEFYRKAYNIPSDVKLRGKININADNITFGKNVTLYPGVEIWGNGKIVIGDNVSIGKDTIIFSTHEITIGNNVAIAAQTYIIDCDHGIVKNELIRKQPLIAEPIYIGNDVWIGAGAKILKGSYISDGAVIGALGLVRGFIEPYSINVGIPAKKRGERKDFP